MKTNMILYAAAMLLVSQASFAQSLAERMAAANPNASKTVEIMVAAGDPHKANYKTVLPLVNHHLNHALVDLKPDASTGSFQSATAVCLGLDPAAIVQRDAAQNRTGNNDDGQSCDGKFMKAGSGLYPYYGFWVVRYDESASNVHAQIKEFNGKSQTLHVSGGDSGSGGQTTLLNLKNSNPLWKATISVETYDADTSLRLLRDHQIDGFLIMDGHSSAKIDEISSATADDHTTPLYKFLSINPYSEFFDMTDFSNGKMYGKARLSQGGLFSGHTVDTITTDAIMIVNVGFQSKNAKAVNALAAAVDAALPDIHTATKTPNDYEPTN